MKDIIKKYNNVVYKNLGVINNRVTKINTLLDGEVTVFYKQE